MAEVKMQRTFIAIKPDAVHRGLTGEILSRFERKGFTIIGLKMIHLTKEIAAVHYQEHFGKPFYNNLINFITEGPIVAIVLQGFDVIDEARKMMGATNPKDALPGTIRFDFAQVKECNVIHGSDSPESAEREIAIYFNKNEIIKGKERLTDYYLKKYAL